MVVFEQDNIEGCVRVSTYYCLPYSTQHYSVGYAECMKLKEKEGNKIVT